MKQNSSLTIEKEFKFLLKDADILKRIIPLSTVDIIQGYLTKPEDSSDIRLRKINNGEFLITVKEGEGFSRLENEVEINESQFLKLWENVKGRYVEKTRYELFLRMGNGDYLAELDVYHGRHNGLVVLEIEVDKNVILSEADMPDWILRNVTGDKRYSNRSLACNGMPE